MTRTSDDLPAGNLLTVCGSLQRHSANHAVLAVAEDRARARGCGVDAYRALADLPPFNPDDADNAGPAVDAWHRRVGAADAVLLAIPEYAGGMAGAAKNALDWLVGSGELYGKPTAVVSAGTTGGVHALRMAVQTLLWQGAFVVGCLGIAAPRTKMTGGAVTDPSTLHAITTLVDGVIDVHGAEQSALASLSAATARSIGIDHFPHG